LYLKVTGEQIIVEYYILDVEIIFSLMKIVEGMSVKGA